MDVSPHDVVINKGVDANVDQYSAFTNTAGQPSGVLHTMLTAAGVRDVYVISFAPSDANLD